jgi:hypothetical protein
MRFITVNVGTHGVETTVSEMRKRLSRILANLQGDQKVFFNFVMHVEPRVIEVAEADRSTSKPRSLEAPYKLDEYTDWAGMAKASGLWGYANLIEGVNVAHGELAREED